MYSISIHQEFWVKSSHIAHFTLHTGYFHVCYSVTIPMSVTCPLPVWLTLSKGVTIALKFILNFNSTLSLSTNTAHYRVCLRRKTALNHLPPDSMSADCTHVLSSQLWHVRPSSNPLWAESGVSERGKHTIVKVARSEIENCCHSQKPDTVHWLYPWRNFILSTLPIAISPMCRKRKNLPSPGTSIVQCLAGPETVTLMGSIAKGTLLPPTCVIFSRDYVLMFRACL